MSQSPQTATRDDSYEAARHNFRDLAKQCGARLTAHRLSHPLAASEDLTIDAAVLPCQDPAGPQLLITSGLHGVEGFAGSCVQKYLLQQLLGSKQVPASPITLVHGLNPYGFAKLRRWNEDGIDLNRNFRSSDDGYRGCSESYRHLQQFLNPDRPPGAIDDFWFFAPIYLVRYGKSHLSQAIAGGQYEYPKGLFFGGFEASFCKRLIDIEIQHWASGPGPLYHIDLHTGLGAYQEVQCFLESPLSPQRLEQLRSRLSPHRLRGDDNLEFEAPGAIGRYLSKVLGTRYCGLTLEMGTCSPATLLRLLRRENQAHHACGYDSTAARQAREALRDAFAPADPSWWQNVIPAAAGVIQRVLQFAREAYVRHEARTR